MRKLTLAALCAAAMACGGGDEAADPASRKFTYGAASSPTAEEQAAAATAEGTTADAIALRTDTSATADARASSVAGLPDTMAASAWGSASVAAATGLPGAGLERTLSILGGPSAAALTGFDDPACVSVSVGSIAYDGCTITMGTDAITVDGTVTRAGSTVTWSLTSTLTSAGDGYSMTVVVHPTGSLTFGAGTVAGRARSDTSATVRSGLTSMHLAYTTLADLDLEHDGNGCITGGTLELRRVWTDRVPGMPSDGPYADAGLLFTWQGCGVVLVSRAI
ncbi:hypothetical protein [Anaeromyxobacter dehalogenans]|nr:hypothetical protein [Anaeromyxobacter dehalogenans]